MALLSGELIRERFGAGSLPSVLSRSYMVFSLVDLGEFAEAVSVGEEAVRIADEADTAHSQVLAAHSLGLAYLCQRGLRPCDPAARADLAPLPSRAYSPRGPPARLGARLCVRAFRAGRRRHIAARTGGAANRGASKSFSGMPSGSPGWERPICSPAARTTRSISLNGGRACAPTRNRDTGLCAPAPRRDRRPETQPDVEKAEAAYQQALTLADPLGMRPLRAHCQLGLGPFTSGRSARQAKAELSAAEALFRSMEMTLWPHGLRRCWPKSDGRAES